MAFAYKTWSESWGSAWGGSWGAVVTTLAGPDDYPWAEVESGKELWRKQAEQDAEARAELIDLFDTVTGLKRLPTAAELPEVRAAVAAEPAQTAAERQVIARQLEAVNRMQAIIAELQAAAEREQDEEESLLLLMQ